MHLEAVSSGAQAHHNEDWAAAIGTPDGCELIMLDGATSVADRDYIDPVHGDVTWFVGRFADALAVAVRAGFGQEEAVNQAVAMACREYLERGARLDIPRYAWPIAAFSWIRVRMAGAGHRLELYCLGDCKSLMRTPDGAVQDLDPFVNPQEAIVRAEVAKLQAEGVDDPASRLQRLLPMLRARRVFQNTALGTNSLCLRPNGAFAARRYTVDAPAGSSLLVMTDGFYRLVDTYGLHTPASLFTLCTEHGLQAALGQLREFESAGRDAVQGVVKKVDDASAVFWKP